MRSFFISVTMFFAMLVLIAANHFYINSVADKLENMVSSLSSTDSSECINEIDNIELFWEKERSLCRLSIRFSELNNISDGISSIRSYALSKNESQFKCSAELLINSIEEFRRQESLELGNIF